MYRSTQDSLGRTKETLQCIREDAKTYLVYSNSDNRGSGGAGKWTLLCIENEAKTCMDLSRSESW